MPRISLGTINPKDIYTTPILPSGSIATCRIATAKVKPKEMDKELPLIEQRSNLVIDLEITQCSSSPKFIGTILGFTLVIPDNIYKDHNDTTNKGWIFVRDKYARFCETVKIPVSDLSTEKLLGKNLTVKLDIYKGRNTINGFLA